MSIIVTQPSWAEERWATPAQVEGPYYPRPIPEEKDWDLLRTKEYVGFPEGIPLQLEGKVLDSSGFPILNARIEIWQSDNKGLYNHPKAPQTEKFDPKFQGFGSVKTNSKGYYKFLTIMPVLNEKRPPHLHVKIYRDGRENLTTQLYLKDHPENNKDGLLSLMLYPGQRKLLINPKKSDLEGGIKGKKAWFDFVLVNNF